MGLTFRRVVGAALLVASYVPVHRLLAAARAGPAGVSTRAAAEAAWSVGLYGSLLVLGVAVALGLLVPAGALERPVREAADRLVRPGPIAFAFGLGLLATLLTLAVARLVYGGLPTSVDEMAQLLHARALSAGRLAVPLPGDPSAWTIQNGVVTSRGWASIYPPFHTLALALGLTLGAPWAVGPVMVGVGTWASTRAFEELLGRLVGRAAGVLLAVSPFWLLLGATHLSHTTAAASLALVLWTALRARDGSLAWSLACGAATGAAVTARPWIGLVTSVTVVVSLWWPVRERLPGRLSAMVAGGLPFAALLFWWNARLFGGPLRLGYSAAFGPSHSLGFHVDPWGNVYGAREALGYTGADLTQLGAHLLETPLPAVALVGVALVLGMRRSGSTPFLAWIVTALGANALYWHHGVHMGPRMLYETVPAWVALVAASASFLTGGSVEGRLRRVSGWAVAASVAAALALAPGVFARAGAVGESTAYASLPAAPGDSLSVVFVHGSWSSRVVARLTASGMRRDSVETALRRNGICSVDRYARWRAADPDTRAAGPPELDLRPLPGTPPGLRRVALSPGNVVWMAPGPLRDDACRREAAADRQGVLELEPLLWRAPPLPGRSLIVARDMGPALNAAVRAALSDHEAFVYVPPAADAPTPVVLDYGTGMRRLWGAEAEGP